MTQTFATASKEITLRRNGKWAVISGSRGKWHVGFGWQGAFAPAKKQLWPTKDGALVAANNWLED